MLTVVCRSTCTELSLEFNELSSRIFGLEFMTMAPLLFVKWYILIFRGQKELLELIWRYISPLESRSRTPWLQLYP